MTDRGTVADWIGRYTSAWDTNEPADIRSLFTPDAEYRYKPYERAVRGHDAITASWLDGRDGPGDHVFSWETLAIDGEVAVVQGRTEYTAGPAAGRVYDNLWVVRFAPDGRATAFTEWFMQQPTAPEG